MSNQNYVGQYFINEVEQGRNCEQEVGECVWEDSDNLLCANYAKNTAGREFHSILLIPVCSAKKIKWYAKLDEFRETISRYKNCRPEITMTSKERDEFLSITELPEMHTDVPWCMHFSLTGNCVARLGRCFKEYPDSGKHLAHIISTTPAENIARKATIDAITKIIADARLSTDEITQLTRVTYPIFDDEIPF